MKLEKKIKWPKILATFSTRIPDDHVSLTTPHPVLSHDDLLSQAAKKGRLTLRGENGSGKSTALMLVKNALANRAFLLPTYSQLSFTSETNKYSTGESLHNRLIEILERVDVDVLLLDEWDANLDSDNQERLSALIDQLSLKKCVIEVRHR
jgi:ABC-type transport system involved in cytochrome bd biosynthesis fused ATPase/permease subunit